MNLAFLAIAAALALTFIVGIAAGNRRCPRCGGRFTDGKGYQTESCLGCGTHK